MDSEIRKEIIQRVAAQHQMLRDALDISPSLRGVAALMESELLIAAITLNEMRRSMAEMTILLDRMSGYRAEIVVRKRARDLTGYAHASSALASTAQHLEDLSTKVGNILKEFIHAESD